MAAWGMSTHKKPPADRVPGVPWGWNRRRRFPHHKLATRSRLVRGGWIRRQERQLDKSQRRNTGLVLRTWCWCRQCDRVWSTRKRLPAQCPSCLSRAWRHDVDELALNAAPVPLWAVPALRPRLGTLRHKPKSRTGRRAPPGSPPAATGGSEP